MRKLHRLSKNTVANLECYGNERMAEGTEDHLGSASSHRSLHVNLKVGEMGIGDYEGLRVIVSDLMDDVRGFCMGH